MKKARGPEAWWAMADEVGACLYALQGDVVSPDLYVVEVPQVYRFGRKQTDPDDLIQLAGVGGAIAATVLPKAARGYYPREWKGQVPKDIMTERIRMKLSSTERKTIQPCPDSLRHNVLDAVGIGLFHVGRLGRGFGG